MHPKYQEVINLRKKGQSYGEIVKIVGVSKNSISRWCQNLKLPLSAQKILEKKNTANREILAKYNKLKSKKAQIEHQKIKKSAANYIRPLSKYELLLVGTALYWGEGWNKENISRGHSVCFVNSNPDMIRLFLYFLQKIIKVSKEKIKLSIQIHPNISEKDAIKFWSKITTFSSENFAITRQISRASQRKRPFNSLPYGTLKINVNSCQKFYQIKGWIDGLIQQT